MRRARVAFLVSAVLLLAACTDVVAGVASPADPPSSSAPPSGGGIPMPSPPAPPDDQLPDDPPAPTDTGDDGGPAQSGSDGDAARPVRISGLHLDTEDGSGRLVVNLSGAGVPEWTVGYSEATGPGGGPVDISGDAFLRVRLRTQAASGSGSTTNLRSSPGPIVQVLTTGLSDGYEEVLIGIGGGERPFRAVAVTDPGRIVIDVG
jgi:hypothetical protein